MGYQVFVSGEQVANNVTRLQAYALVRRAMAAKEAYVLVSEDRIIDWSLAYSLGVYEFPVELAVQHESSECVISYRTLGDDVDQFSVYLTSKDIVRDLILRLLAIETRQRAYECVPEFFDSLYLAKKVGGILGSLQPWESTIVHHNAQLEHYPNIIKALEPELSFEQGEGYWTITVNDR